MNRYLTPEGKSAALVLALVLFTLASLTYHFWPTTSDASAPKQRVRYIECAEGNVHAWVTSEGGIAVLPAGGSCP